MAKYYYKGIPAVQAARKNGITDAAFYARMCNGWTIGQAVKTPMGGTNPSKQWVITNYQNKAFNSASALAEYLGVTKNTVIGQEHRHGSPFKIGKYIIEKR